MIVFMKSWEYVDVDLTNEEEVAARIYYLMTHQTTGADDSQLRMSWSHPYDRLNAIAGLRDVERAKALAREFMQEGRIEGAHRPIVPDYPDEQEVPS